MAKKIRGNHDGENGQNENFQISHLKVRSKGRGGETTVLRTINF